MKLITRDTDYAVRALCFIARSNKAIVSVSDLAKTLKISKPFLRKILQVLNKKGIVKSYKGQGGGFMLNYRPNKISLLNLVEAFQEPIELEKCLFKKKICPRTNTCKLRGKINNIQRCIKREFKNITLASLLGKHK